jgi:hypothetical protein
MTTKKCGTCGADKPLSEFDSALNGNGYRSLRKHCRPCMRIRDRRRFERTQMLREQSRLPLPTYDDLAVWYAAGCPL